MEKAQLLILCCETLPSFRPPTTQKWIRQFLIETEEKKGGGFFFCHREKWSQKYPNFRSGHFFRHFFHVWSVASSLHVCVLQTTRHLTSKRQTNLGSHDKIGSNKMAKLAKDVGVVSQLLLFFFPSFVGQSWVAQKWGKKKPLFRLRSLFLFKTGGRV